MLFCTRFGAAKQDFPVLLTLHGTSLTASNSADSYKFKARASDADYRFGVDGLWVCAPTRFGAHNWEGPGARTLVERFDIEPFPDFSAKCANFTGLVLFCIDAKFCK